MGERYDPELRTSESGSRLYNAWRSMRKHPHIDLWESYSVFHTWSVYNGYTLGSWLRRIDETLPYGPDNCVWYITDDNDRPLDAEERKRADEWNAVVNRIRKHYGMPPLSGTSYEENNNGE